MCDDPPMAADGPTSDARSGTQAVERALWVLRAFEAATDDLGISEVAHATGLSMSTAHRLTRALCAGGLLTQDPRSERYQLGPALVVLGRLAEDRLGLERARPVLDLLAADTGESVSLGILTGGDVTVVLTIASNQPLRFSQPPGHRIPAHTSAMGKCLLAGQGDIDGTVAALGPLEAATDNTVTDRRRLSADLEEVRRRGWALNDEERNPGVRAVAAPVRHRDRTIAAIAVQGPVRRLPDDRLDSVAERVIEAAGTVAPVLAATLA